MESLLIILGQRNEILQIVILSIMVSGSATLISTAIAVPLGSWMGLADFRGRSTLMRLVYTLMALPPVLAGLIVYMLFSRSGPLGYLELLFTPVVMIVAQCLLVIPIVTGLTAAAVAAKEGLIFDHALSLGATKVQAIATVIIESRTGIVSAIMTGFGRAFAEVGAVMLVGGNVKGETRVLTTSIVMETRQGNFEMGIALGLILLIVSFIISSIVLLNANDMKQS